MFFLNGPLIHTLNTKRCCLSVLICALCPRATLNTTTRLASSGQNRVLPYLLILADRLFITSPLFLSIFLFSSPCTLSSSSSALASSHLLSPPLLPASSASHPLRFVSHFTIRYISGFSPPEPLKLREQHVFWFPLCLFNLNLPTLCCSFIMTLCYTRGQITLGMTPAARPQPCNTEHELFQVF